MHCKQLSFHLNELYNKCLHNYGYLVCYFKVIKCKIRVSKIVTYQLFVDISDIILKVISKSQVYFYKILDTRSIVLGYFMYYIKATVI